MWVFICQITRKKHTIALTVKNPDDGLRGLLDYLVKDIKTNHGLVEHKEEILIPMILSTKIDVYRDSGDELMVYDDTNSDSANEQFHSIVWRHDFLNDIVNGGIDCVKSDYDFGLVPF